MHDRDKLIIDCIDEAKRVIENKDDKSLSDFSVYGLLNFALTKMTSSKWQKHISGFMGFISSDAKDDDEIWYCPLCSHGFSGYNAFAYNYCPECGARMERGERNV